jgi:cytochrome c oxidase cbb3-type subunit III
MDTTVRHLTDFWHWYIVILSVVSIVGCAVLLKSQTTKRPAKGEKVELHGNVWDEDLAEYNNPLPNWWRWLFYITVVFALGYLAFYPGLGNFGGRFAWSSSGQYNAEVEKANAEFGPIFAKYAAVDIPTLARDPNVKEVGERLFLNYCAQCHGSDAAGGSGFPNLRDMDWLYGGDPVAIETTILNGRNGVMPPLGEALGTDGVKQVVQYVRSLSGLSHNAALAAEGKNKFVVCAACHGNDGKGNRMLGAPNLTDKIWLYGSSEEAITEGILNGRNNAMPAQGDRLGKEKVHVLAAYVYSLGGGEPPVAAAAPSVEPTSAPATAPASPASAPPPTK